MALKSQFANYVSGLTDGEIHVVRGLPVFGSAFWFGRDPLSFLEHLSQQATVSRFQLGKLPVYLIHDPELIGEGLKSKSGQFEKSEFADELRQVVGNGLVTSDGEAWQKHRKIMSPVMQRKQLESYIPAISSTASKYASQLTTGQHDVHEYIMTLALEIISDVLFKAKIGDSAHAVSQSLESVTTHFHTLALGWQRILPRWLPTHARRSYKKEGAKIETVVSDIIEAQKAKPGNSAKLLRVLLEAQTQGNISQLQVLDEALTMFLAGHETTALALSFTLYLLAGDIDVQQRLQQEVDSLEDRPLTLEDVSRLPYAQAVINESMRIYPPIWSIIRRTTASTRLGGLNLERGDHVMIAQWSLSRDPQWFPEPERFRPERWLGDAKPPRFAFIPFGGGGRKCIGDHFAMLEATLILAELVRHASFSRTKDFKLELVPSVTLRPKHGIDLQVQPRNV